MRNFFKSKLPLKNALILIDIQEKIIAPINNKDSIIKNIQKLLPKVGFTKIEKLDFSLASSQNLFEELDNKKITTLIICGFETHICIQQSVLEFLKKGYEVQVISDAMGSRNNLDHQIALQRMLHKGAIITTTESMIFEICKTSDRKEFKEISNIIKN